MRVAVVAAAPEAMRGIANGQPSDMEVYYDVSSEGHTVSVAPADRADIAHATDAHGYFPSGDLDALFDELVRPVVVQAVTREAAQGMIVVDGGPLARLHVMHDERSGLLRATIGTCLSATGVEAVEVGFAELDVGDSFVDMFDPNAAHPPQVIDNTELYCSILHGLSTHDGRDPETIDLVESLYNPNRHQVVAISMHHRGPRAPDSVTWIYIVSLAVRENPRSSSGHHSRVNLSTSSIASGAGAAGHASGSGPFRNALQNVTACIAAPQRPSSVPFSQSRLTHLMKAALCDDIQPATWVVALAPTSSRHRQRPSEPYRDACVAITSARRVASVCRPASFPHDLVDFATAVSPQSGRGSAGSASPPYGRPAGHHQQQQRTTNSRTGGGGRLSGGHRRDEDADAAMWLSPKSPGEAAYFDAVADESGGLRDPRRSSSNPTVASHHGAGSAGGTRLTSVMADGAQRRGSVSPAPDSDAPPEPVPLRNPSSAASSTSPPGGRASASSAATLQQLATHRSPSSEGHHHQQHHAAAATASALSSSEAALWRRHAEAIEAQRAADVEAAQERERRQDAAVAALRRELAAEQAQREEHEGSLQQVVRLLESRIEEQDAAHTAELGGIRETAEGNERKLRERLRTAEAAAKELKKERDGQHDASVASSRAGGGLSTSTATAGRAAARQSAAASRGHHASGKSRVVDADATTVSLQFKTYRDSMEPTLRRLRTDCEKLDAALAEAGKHARAKDRTIARLEGEVNLLRRELEAATEQLDHSHGQANDDAAAASAEAQRLRVDLDTAHLEIEELRRANSDLDRAIAAEAAARVGKDDVIEGLRLELASAQQQQQQQASSSSSHRRSPAAPMMMTVSATAQTTLTQRDMERMVSIEEVLGHEARLMQARIATLERDLAAERERASSSTSRAQAAADDGQATRVASLEAELHQARRNETEALHEVSALRGELDALKRPVTATSGVQAGRPQESGGYDVDSRAVVARLGQPSSRPGALRSPSRDDDDDDRGAQQQHQHGIRRAETSRPTSTRARSRESSPMRRARSTSQGRAASDGGLSGRRHNSSSGGGASSITGQFAFRQDELDRVMQLVSREKASRARSNDNTGAA